MYAFDGLLTELLPPVIFTLAVFKVDTVPFVMLTSVPVTFEVPPVIVTVVAPETLLIPEVMLPIVPVA